MKFARLSSALIVVFLLFSLVVVGAAAPASGAPAELTVANASGIAGADQPARPTVSKTPPSVQIDNPIAVQAGQMMVWMGVRVEERGRSGLIHLADDTELHQRIEHAIHGGPR